MSPEAQRTAIAKAVGWKPTTDAGICWDSNGTAIISPPDYCNDLNEMHKAESHIIKSEWQTIRDYEDALQKHVSNIVFANAAQRAEAFLRTLNLWTDDN